MINVVIFIVVIIMVCMINFMYAMFHCYMRKNVEHSYRLLNVLYSHLAIWLQIGSFINVFILLQDFNFVDFKYWMLLVYCARYLQLMMVFIYFFVISITTNIHNFKSSLYLDLSCKLSGPPVFTFLTFVG